MLLRVFDCLLHVLKFAVNTKTTMRHYVMVKMCHVHSDFLNISSLLRLRLQLLAVNFKSPVGVLKVARNHSDVISDILERLNCLLNLRSVHPDLVHPEVRERRYIITIRSDLIRQGVDGLLVSRPLIRMGAQVYGVPAVVAIVATATKWKTTKQTTPEGLVFAH